MQQIIAQIFGLIGMAMNSLSFQAKRQRTVILMQMIGTSFFTANMLLLGAYSGTILNFLCAVRALVYANKEKIRNVKAWTIGFMVCYVLSYAAVFLILKKPATPLNLLIELLPTSGMIVSTIALTRKDAAAIRKAAWFVSPVWLIYNCCVFSLGGIICEIISIVSVLIATLRLDRKKKQAA